MGSLDNFDLVDDARMMRRLKRRRFDIKSFELNSCGRSIEKTLKDNQLGDGTVDDDYMKFLIHLGEYSQSECCAREDDYDDGDHEDDLDPQYMMFLKNLREDGKSYVLEVAKNSGVSEFVKYEIEGGSDEECEPQTRRKSRNVTKGEKIEDEKDLRILLSEDKVENPKILRSVPEKERRNSLAEKDLSSEPFNPVSHGRKECPSQKLSPEDDHKSEPQCKSDVEDAMVDDTYHLFLDGIKPEGDCIVFVTESGKRIKYEEDDVESSSDSEIFVSDHAPFCDEGNFTSFVTSREFDSSMEGDDCQCLGSPSKNDQIQFREKVIGFLKRPYNHKEYEELLKEVQAQKPMEGHRDLRGRIKSYSADRCSKSYLEHYSDLKRKFHAVQVDRRKQLNILRGFFYWLKHLSHEGAFRPWNDSACLAVMPGSRR